MNSGKIPNAPYNPNASKLVSRRFSRRPKIFFSDLDGTLLTSEKTISPRTREALGAFVRAGNIFAVNTGRELKNVQILWESLDLPLPRMVICAFNGALIYDCGRREILFRSGVPLPVVRRVLRMAREDGIHAHTYNDEAILSPRPADERGRECLEYYSSRDPLPVIFTERPEEHLTCSPCKCIAIELRERKRLEAFRERLEASFREEGDAVTTLFSSRYYLEIFGNDAGKGAAVRRVCEALDIPREHTIAAGDAENDREMLREAGCGIAMSNGDPVIFPDADVITEQDNDHDGLAAYLEESI